MKKAFLILSFLFLTITFTKSSEASSFHFGFSTGHRGYYSPYRYYGWSPYSWRPYYSSPFYYRSYGYGPYRSPHPYGRNWYDPGEVRTEVEPKDAKVYVDGRYVGVADDYDSWWQRLKLEPGNRRIVFRKEGYAPYVLDLRIAPDGDQHIKYDMRPGDDSLSEEEMRGNRQDENSRRPGERYQYEDENRRRNDDYGDRDRDRSYDRDRDRGYGDRDRDRNSRDDEYRERDSRERNPAPYRDEDRRRTDSNRDYEASNRIVLKIQVHPADASVYVDDEYYSASGVKSGGEVRASLPIGVHRVEVVRPGYETYTKEVNVTANEADNQIVVYLKKK